MCWATEARSEDLLSVAVTTVDGPTIQGILIDWSTESVTLRDTNQQLEFAATELLSIHHQSPTHEVASSDILVQLIDGTRFPAMSFEVANHLATIETQLSAIPLSIPTEHIAFVILSNAEEPAQSLLSKLDKETSTSDVLVISKKESSELNLLNGVINDVSVSDVNFTWEGEAIPVKRSKVVALSYFHSRPVELNEPVCWLHLGSGIQIPVAKILRDGSGLALTTTLELHFNVPLTSIQTADYSVGKLTYLSDLEPFRQKWTPLIELPTSDERVKLLGMPRRDTSFDGSPLTLSWQKEEGKEDEEGIILKSYAKGLALRSRTNLEYRLPRGMRRFVATAGIDPETLAQGNVLLSIAADGEALFETVIDGSQPPVAIDVEISGKQKLQILVDYGSNLDLGDRLHLVEARLVK